MRQIRRQATSVFPSCRGPEHIPQVPHGPCLTCWPRLPVDLRLLALTLREEAGLPPINFQTGRLLPHGARR